MILNFMSINSLIQIVLYFVVLFLLAKPLGLYMAKVYSGEKFFLSPVMSPLENLFYKLIGTKNILENMSWKKYAGTIIIFSFFGFLLLFVLLSFQAFLPLNPQSLSNLSPDLAFNTAISFISNTNWQAYAGESSLSYFSQMFGLSVQNFVSAAVGMAVLIALIRGIVQKNSLGIGNFWVDFTKSVLYILLPLSFVLTLLLGSQGVVQTFSDYAQATLLDSPTKTTQIIALGPVASQVAIKQLGTNGGGFFNANSAHPLENPTPFSNFLQMLAILLIPAALCYTFGQMVGDKTQGTSLFKVMTIIFIPLLLFAFYQEQAINPKFKAIQVDQSTNSLQAGGNMEGKENRFGIVNSVLWAAATTAASSGSVNSTHSSYTPLGGLVPLVLMQFGEVIYGGVGSGLYGILMFLIITVFIVGLMVGRTPEYMNKKIQAFEVKMACVVILIPCFTILLGSALALMSETGQKSILNPGPHGFSEILYALTSASNNNGSAFAGLSANNPFFNILLGFCMLLGRFWVIIPVLAIAGSLAQKNTVAPSAGTMPTNTLLFILVLVATIVLIGVLTFVPALALGPIAEYFSIG